MKKRKRERESKKKKKLHGIWLMRGLPSRGYNLMVDLLIYKPFNPFTPPIPPELHRNPLSLLDFALMPVSIRFGKYSPPNP